MHHPFLFKGKPMDAQEVAAECPDHSPEEGEEEEKGRKGEEEVEVEEVVVEEVEVVD